MTRIPVTTSPVLNAQKADVLRHFSRRLQALFATEIVTRFQGVTTLIHRLLHRPKVNAMSKGNARLPGCKILPVDNFVDNFFAIRGTALHPYARVWLRQINHIRSFKNSNRDPACAVSGNMSGAVCKTAFDNWSRPLAALFFLRPVAQQQATAWEGVSEMKPEDLEVIPCDCCDGKIVHEGIEHHFHDGGTEEDYLDLLAHGLKGRLLLDRVPGDDWMNKSLVGERGIDLRIEQAKISVYVSAGPGEGAVKKIAVIAPLYMFTTNPWSLVYREKEEFFGDWCDSAAQMIELARE